MVELRLCACLSVIIFSALTALGSAGASSPGPGCKTLTAGISSYKAAFGNDVQVFQCEERIGASREVRTFVHRIDVIDSGVCIALRDQVELVAGKPRKTAPRPEDVGAIFMRVGENRRACDAYSWEEFAHVSNVSAPDFAALRAHLLDILSDMDKTQALLRQGTRNLSENAARSMAARLEAARLKMKINLMSHGPFLWGNGDGATVMLHLESVRVFASVAYEPGRTDTIRVDTMFAGEGMP